MANSSKAHDMSHPSPSNPITGEVPELSVLQAFISSPEPSEDVSEGSISALLKQLETADGVAKGVESKLDKLLENLEGLLESLEGARGAQSEDGTNESGPDLPGSLES